MHVVIGGYGRVGRYLAYMLEERGHTVAVIDRNEIAFAAAGRDMRGRRISGEVFDRTTLEKAGIADADAFAAVTSGDNSNIVSARIARERFNVPCVVARIYDPRRARIYERFGIPTISSVNWSGSMLLATILEPDVKTTATYGGGEVLTITADASLTLTGKRVSNLDYPGKFHISAIVRDGVARLPEPRTELAKGDRLSITVTREALPELKRLLDLD
ncbi:MAG: TrkA family potassium uptake protein [Coriobacteriia bacterium]|nr:TrkA family potassium uptake protein [Coriobacteriia bacterium]